MTLLAPQQVLMRNLRGEIPSNWRVYLPREEALEQLRSVSGKDFGMDVDAWQGWVSANKDAIRDAAGFGEHDNEY